LEAVKLLIDRGADTSLKDDRGKTAKEIATQAGQNEIASLLGSD